MKTNFTHYYFLISCPSDVEKDINIVFEIVDDINRRVGEENHIHIMPLFWKKDAIPAAGNSAQNIINHQLLEEADGVIALFWTKFGTPTDTYGSGTEEEIVKAIEENKDVILLYSERDIALKQVDYEQFCKVEAFKKAYNGLFASYCTDNDLKEQLRRILTKLIFKYARESKNIGNEVIIREGINEYSLAEYFELGWFLRRSYLEIPSDASSSVQEKNLFKDRMSVLLTLVMYYNLLDDNKYHSIVEYSEEIQRIGLKGYMEEYGKEKFITVQEILDICEIGLTKKLVKKQAAAFQIGMIYGHYLLSVQLEWLTEHSLNILNDIIQIKKEELEIITQQIFSFLEYIDVGLCKKIKGTWTECHENMNIDLGTYNNKMNTLAEEIIHHLQLYS